MLWKFYYFSDNICLSGKSKVFLIVAYPASGRLIRDIKAQREIEDKELGK